MNHNQVDSQDPAESDSQCPEQLAKKRPRPDVLTGVTQRIQTGHGKLYVTINEDSDGRAFELFANIGSSGGFTASFTEALAKIVSTGLRSSVDPEEIASELRGIRSPKVGWNKGDKTQSIPDAIGLAMTRYLEDDPDLDYPHQQNLAEAIGEDATNLMAVRSPTRRLARTWTATVTKVGKVTKKTQLLHSSRLANLPNVQTAGQCPCTTRKDVRPAGPVAGQNVSIMS